MPTKKFIPDFLIPSLNSQKFGEHLQWLDKANKIFKIDWHDRMKPGWTEREGEIFIEWANIKSGYQSNDLQYNPRRKNRFKSALQYLVKKEKLIPLACENKYQKKYIIAEDIQQLMTMDDGSSDSDESCEVVEDLRSMPFPPPENFFSGKQADMEDAAEKVFKKSDNKENVIESYHAKSKKRDSNFEGKMIDCIPSFIKENYDYLLEEESKFNIDDVLNQAYIETPPGADGKIPKKKLTDKAVTETEENKDCHSKSHKTICFHNAKYSHPKVSSFTSYFRDISDIRKPPSCSEEKLESYNLSSTVGSFHTMTPYSTISSPSVYDKQPSSVKNFKAMTPQSNICSTESDIASVPLSLPADEAINNYEEKHKDSVSVGRFKTLTPHIVESSPSESVLTTLNTQLGAQEAVRQNTEEDASSAERRIILIEQENIRCQVARMKKEMEETERTLKSQIAAQEKKAHENWIAARAAERKLDDMKQEVTQLRQRLRWLERKQENFVPRDEIIRPVPKNNPNETNSRGSQQPPPPERGSSVGSDR